MRWLIWIVMGMTLLSACAGVEDERDGEEGDNPPQSKVAAIAIFEVYLDDTAKVDALDKFLVDTIGLPVEWSPYDIFGNRAVYDAAYFLGNTTFELLALYERDSSIAERAKYNRIIFATEQIDSTARRLAAANMPQQPPFDFNINSGGENLTIGRQINLDSLSSISNVNVAFWEYAPGWHTFSERATTSTSLAELTNELERDFASNPLGILGVKEIHLTMDRGGEDLWSRVLGPAREEGWVLDRGPVISYELAYENKGVNWITLGVKNLSEARAYLSEMKIANTVDTHLLIDRTRLYGLEIRLDTMGMAQ